MHTYDSILKLVIELVQPMAPAGRGVGEDTGRDVAGHQENDLGTSGTPENGGRSGEEMRPCAAARR